MAGLELLNECGSQCSLIDEQRRLRWVPLQGDGSLARVQYELRGGHATFLNFFP